MVFVEPDNHIGSICTTEKYEGCGTVSSCGLTLHTPRRHAVRSLCRWTRAYYRGVFPNNRYVVRPRSVCALWIISEQAVEEKIFNSEEVRQNVRPNEGFLLP